MCTLYRVNESQRRLYKLRNIVEYKSKSFSKYIIVFILIFRERKQKKNYHFYATNLTKILMYCA